MSLVTPETKTLTAGQPAPTTCAHPRTPAKKVRVAYFVSRFPKLTETFVLYEMQQIEREGVAVELYALQRERTSVMHPEAGERLPHVHFSAWLGWSVFVAHLYYLSRRPFRYLASLAILLRENFGSLRYLAGAILFFPKVVAFARRMELRQIDHIHAHFASHPAMAAWVVHRLTGVTYSFTAHGSDLHRDQHMLARKISDASFVVTISEFNRKILARFQRDLETPIQVVRCGVTPEWLAEPSAASDSGDSRLSPQTLHIACVGTLHEVKGQRHLLNALHLLQTRGVPIRCRLVGDGPDRNDLKSLAGQWNIEGSIEFLGRCTQSRVRSILDNSDVVVVPSVPSRDGRKEGLPVVLMEAMARRCVVVASRLSGIPELVEHEKTGLLTEPGDSSGLAGALERLYDDERLRHSLAEAGRQRVEQQHSLDCNAARLAQHIRRAVGQAPLAGKDSPCQAS